MSDKAKPGAASAAPGCKRNASVARGGIVHSDVTADSPGPFGNGCMFSDVARVFVISGNACCGGNGAEASCKVCRRDLVTVTAATTCAEADDVLKLRCVREAGHDGYHVHDDGNAVAAWAPDTDRRPA